MATTLTLRVNNTVNTDTGNDYATLPGNYVDVDFSNDYLIFAEETTEVIDGADEPTSSELDEAATLIKDVDNEVSKCFLFDASAGTAGLLDEVPGFGSGVDQYVFLASFDGPTASEPTLEAWDDTNHSSAGNHVLGSGTPASSMLKAILTTDSAPGVGWGGTAIAASNKLNLNGGAGALTAAKDCYFNLQIKIPANYASSFTETFVLTIRYTWS